MKSAHKWKCAGAIAALGMLITVVPIVAEATPVDPAIIARFKKLAPFQQRLAALRNRLLIERGRRLFMNETFDGNGRTCATCHPPTNNFTIDAAFIARLPQSDPLFVAEKIRTLSGSRNPTSSAGADPRESRRLRQPRRVSRRAAHARLTVSTKPDPANRT